MLTLDHVSFSYNATDILTDLNATFSRGVVGIIGTNGAGKTTLLRVMAGLLVPQRGAVRWQGGDVQIASKAWRRSVGYLPQSPGLYPQMTGHEFLDYMLVLSEWRSNHQRRERIEEIAEHFNITAFLKVRIDELSGGMRQRVALAQAFAHKPAVVFLDEPTNNLDHEERERFHQFLTHTVQRSSPPMLVVYIGHILGELCDVASELLFLHKGTCFFHGEPQAFMDIARQADTGIDSFEAAYRVVRDRVLEVHTQS